MSKILIVDDEVETLSVLNTFLEITGHSPLTTPDPRLAMGIAEREHPDCVLLDVMMPDIDGFTLCKQMRANPLTKGLPIMFITAYAPLDLEDRRRDAGADMVLMKPFGLDALTRMIDDIIVTRPQITETPSAESTDKPVVFRRDANTGVFSASLRDFLANMDYI